uniref:Uncharacterized protein n=1 Tax=Neogobius melanostomus TaxID=47308 RepID=A0A8C6UX51_9GOBI
MASSTPSRSEEQFLCSICLEVFSEPVSTPCGHNFCKRCISQTWDANESCFCPLCKEVFSIRPQLKTNTLFFEMVSQWKLEEERRSKRVSKPGEVQCDVCSEPKLKAVKSCLVCLSSFCESHLQPHLSAPRLKRHQLMEPVDDLEDRMCPTHQRPLELFCNTDQSSVCSMCAFREHKNHEVLSLEEAFEQEKVSLQQTVAENQRLVEQRRLKVQEITAALELSEREAQRETQQMVKVFSDIMESVQRCLDHHTKVMEQSLSKHKERAQALIQQLQQEMCELEKSSTEAQQLSLSTDPLHFLQRCPALPPAGLKDWSSVSFEPQTCEGSAARALSELETSLSQEFNKVGVFVDYGAGLVSFYDVDSADLLYSFTGCCFREKLFPFFNPELNSGGTNSAPLIISAVDTESSTVCEGLK